jgi:hypothetical protein
MLQKLLGGNIHTHKQTQYMDTTMELLSLYGMESRVNLGILLKFQLKVSYK